MRNRWLSNLVAVICLAALAVAVPARADEAAAVRDKPNPTLAEVPASGYVPFTGQPFFLLSDASYGTDQEAMVRLEALAANTRTSSPATAAPISWSTACRSRSIS